MSDCRLIGTFSPYALQKMLEKPRDQESIDFFRSILLFAKRFSHLIFIILPNELKTVIYNRENIELRILYEKWINNINTAVLFPSVLEDSCFDLLFNTEILSNSSINKIITTFLKRNMFPLMFDSSSYYLKKNKCLKCSTPNTKCGNELMFKIKLLDKNIEHDLSNFNLSDVEEWLINEKTFTVENLKKLAYIYAFLFDASKSDVEKFEKVEFSTSFSNDIKKVEAKDMFKLASSVFRGTVYPPFVANSDNKNSLDWHNYKGQKLLDGESMSRIDVMEPTQQTQSGKKRIYRFQKDGRIYILLYDIDHGEDVTSKSLRERLKIIRGSNN